MNNRYHILGNGNEKVLVLHDFFASTLSYDALHNYLDKETFTYVFFDLRGYGRSKTIEGKYTLEEVTSDCIELVEHLGWDTFHVVGHSMTGLTIQQLTLQMGGRVKSATAITPVPATGSPIPEDFLEVIRMGIRGDDNIMTDIINGASGSRYNQVFLSYKLKQFRECATPEARVGYLDMFSKSDISEKVKGLRTPYHVIIGGCDSEWHNREVMESTFSQYYPNCTITEIADASHYPMQETPILLASHIEHFLKQHLQSEELVGAGN